jgi:CheY-like chemotaxis protein
MLHRFYTVRQPRRRPYANNQLTPRPEAQGERVLSRARRGRSPKTRPQPPGGARLAAVIMTRNILIVEDAETTATTLEIALLNLPNTNVVRAPDGLRALEYLAPESGHTIDALVTDLEMPFLDGFELIRRVREQKRFAMLPIVVISGRTDAQTLENVMKLGANAYFAKPCSALAIQKKILDLLP